MWNLKLLLSIIAIVVMSLFIAVKKPDLHKQAVITDSDYSFVEIVQDSVPEKPTAQDINVNTVSIPSVNTVSTKNAGIKNVDNNSGKVIRTTSVTPPKIQKITTSNPSKQTAQTQTVKQQPVSKQEQPSVQKPKVQQKTVEVKPSQNIENKNPKPILTEEEEIIAWNQWRSRLQNQVMKDSKIAAPLGTQFKFSFTVDKYGNMSNVKVWATNPSYSSLAVRVIKPVLMSYRNKPILNFPYGTRRIITNVDGGFVISRVSRYSTPEDYHDYERVKH